MKVTIMEWGQVLPKKTTNKHQRRNRKGGIMAVKDKVAKMLYIDNITAKVIKEIAISYECSESAIIRKALHNYISLYIDLAKKGKEWKQYPAT